MLEGRRISKRKRSVEKKLIGWREWLALPDLGIDNIKAKVDTGARTSAIHAFNIREIEKHGRPHVEFSVHPVQRRREPVVQSCAEILEKRLITSSNGSKSLRYIIKTQLKLGDETWPIEMSFAKRDQLGFRVLLGRQAIRKRCIVDAGVSYRTGKPDVAQTMPVVNQGDGLFHIASVANPEQAENLFERHEQIIDDDPRFTEEEIVGG